MVDKNKVKFYRRACRVLILKYEHDTKIFSYYHVRAIVLSLYYMVSRT